MDSIIMLVTPGYIYLSKYLNINVELIKNFYTLSKLQDNRMIEMFKTKEMIEEDIKNQMAENKMQH